MPAPRALLELRLVDHHLLIEAVNSTGDPVTMVAHARYIQIEVENEHGQYTRSTSRSTLSELPKAANYLTAPKNGRLELFRLPLSIRPGEIHIGEEIFTTTNPRPKIRATYKAADRAMPNLPRNLQRSFFAGPIDGTSEPIV